jgi:hypothetical protein
MGFDASQALRYSKDQVLAIPSILGVSEYAIWLYQTVNAPVSFSDVGQGTPNAPIRITVADGYRSYAAGDGYLNPMLEQEGTQTLVMVNGQLTAENLRLGPIVFPYTFLQFTGGIDPLLFQPPRGNNKHITSYIQVLGTGLATSGNYFVCKSIILDSGMSNISYQVELVAAGANVKVR